MDGSFVLNISTNGTASVMGTLADGAKFTASAKMDENGIFHLFARPYGTRINSFIAATIAMVGDSNIEIINGEPLVFVNKKAASKDATFLDGFNLEYTVTVTRNP